MFNSKRYITKGVQSDIPAELMIFMWNCIDNLPDQCDYFQVFKLENVNEIQKVHHFSEQPEYSADYILTSVRKPVTSKVYVIDDKEYTTMLLANEY